MHLVKASSLLLTDAQVLVHRAKALVVLVESVVSRCRIISKRVGRSTEVDVTPGLDPYFPGDLSPLIPPTFLAPFGFFEAVIRIRGMLHTMVSSCTSCPMALLKLWTWVERASVSKSLIRAFDCSSATAADEGDE